MSDSGDDFESDMPEGRDESKVPRKYRRARLVQKQYERELTKQTKEVLGEVLCVTKTKIMVLPLDVIMLAMNEKYWKWQGERPGPDRELAMMQSVNLAIAAAPYFHPKMQASEINAAIRTNPTHLSDEELLAIVAADGGDGASSEEEAEETLPFVVQPGSGEQSDEASETPPTDYL